MSAQRREQCIGCGAEVLAMDGPIHRYMTSAPGCWQRYGELLNVLYTQPMQQATLIMCVDTYAVQHPGTPNPQAIQSVAVHLLNLYDYLVRGRPVKIPQKTFSEKAFHSIEPPLFTTTLTVLDMPLSGTGDALAAGAHAWAESVWAAWSTHHEQIAEWYTKYAIS
jgi:Family of unknown function (DUF5946)